jgi:hypothetical protein
MKTTLVSFAVALALGMLAGCDRNQTSAQPATTGTTAPAGSGSSAQSNTPSTPANIGTPSPSEKDTQPPVQGREDVRQPEQRKDFQQKGDGAGPKPGG